MLYRVESPDSNQIYDDECQNARQPKKRSNEIKAAVFGTDNQLCCILKPSCLCRNYGGIDGGIRNGKCPLPNRFCGLKRRPNPVWEERQEKGTSQDKPAAILKTQGQPIAKQPFQAKHHANETSIPEVSYQELFQEHYHRLTAGAVCREYSVIHPSLLGSNPSDPEN